MCIIPGNFGAQQGWQCPVCKQVMAPFMPYCPCKGEPPRVETKTNTKEKPDAREPRR